MDSTTLIGVLAFGTLFAVLVFAYRSSVETTRRLQANSRKSTLAADAPNTTPPGVKPPDT
ncbi:MAG: hypothetical protein ACXIUV_00145 [Alkalilacustris sp.]